MKEFFEKEFAPYIGPKRLNVGCGATPEEGWTNVDFNPQAEGVIRHDLRSRPWPFEANAFDTVLASHFLEHFRDEVLFGIMFEIASVLKVGGYLIGIVPYATHSDAYANPYHRQLWDETTPGHFCKATYEVPDNAGTGAHQFMPLANWRVVQVELTPIEPLRGRPNDEVAALHKHGVNVIKEMQFVMQRVN